MAKAKTPQQSLLLFLNCCRDHDLLLRHDLLFRHESVCKRMPGLQDVKMHGLKELNFALRPLPLSASSFLKTNCSQSMHVHMMFLESVHGIVLEVLTYF